MVKINKNEGKILLKAYGEDKVKKSLSRVYFSSPHLVKPLQRILETKSITPAEVSLCNSILD